jgi:hypothetical protein
MTIQAGPYAFDHVVFDDEGDVLYMSIGSPRSARGEVTNEAFFRFDHDTDELIGITITSVRRILQRDGAVTVTLPDGSQVALEGVEAAIKQPT